MRSTPGIRKKSPGPRGCVTRPSRNTMPRSYSRRTRTDEPTSTRTAARTQPPRATRGAAAAAEGNGGREAAAAAREREDPPGNEDTPTAHARHATRHVRLYYHQRGAYEKQHQPERSHPRVLESMIRPP